MAFNLSFAGVSVSITPADGSSNNFLSGVRHENGRIEAGENMIQKRMNIFFAACISSLCCAFLDINNFSGTIVLSETAAGETSINLIPVSGKDDSKVEINQDHFKTNGDASTPIDPSMNVADRSAGIVLVDAIPETLQRSIAFNHYPSLDIRRHDEHNEIQDPFDPNIQSSELSKTYYYEDSIQNNTETTRLDWSPDLDQVSFLEACASDDVKIEHLRVMLKHKPEVAALKDEYGDYPAHVFANNDAVIYGEDSDDDVLEFVFELYCAYPEGVCIIFFIVDRHHFITAHTKLLMLYHLSTAFFTEGSSGQVPFAGAIVNWIDDCHQLYIRDEDSVYLVSELKTLSKSDRIENSLCLRAEVQMLTGLPAKGMLLLSFLSIIV